ncbi:MAG TPA: type IV pili twitching motility protein PilT, partial [Negativicutes bacterium]
RNLIREGKSHQLVSMMQTGSKFGMQTMDSSLLHLYQKGIVCLEDALMRATYPENFIR